MGTNKKNENDQTSDSKIDQLSDFTNDGTDQPLTTNQGLKINDNQNSLKAGERGPTLLEDFIMREKITHFDHERIPERIVHARGVGAHGFFELTESLKEFTKAKFLTEVGKKTPVFTRFSTVAGSRGSTDLARDVRGFAVKFYTEEGNYDLVGNNIPVFFIQDAIKFPDLVHSVKPEPNNEIPQAASAHDTFWDFISLMPESMHMIMWVMSDRAIPRSLRMMEGFGVHTFRLINDEGKATFVKFHWKPKLGVHSVAWNEAQKISGFDADFHRRDLFEAIENGSFAEWEFGVQLIPEDDEHKFDFDILDATKLIPEELVPVRIIGRMVLNRNTDNYFAETEQVAFLPSNIVPGIDFSNDPLLQGRLHSYLDTQISRLGGPNFHEIPINQPLAPIHNNQRDSQFRQTINKGRVAYEPNTLGGGCPYQSMMKDGGFTSHQEKIDGNKIRTRSDSFRDHFTQAALFFNSQSDYEQTHIVNALSFELGKVETNAIRERVVYLLNQIDNKLSRKVADNLGISIPEKLDLPMNMGYPADANPDDYQPIPKKDAKVKKSEILSMANTVKDTIKTRQIAFLVADGFNANDVKIMKNALEKQGAQAKIIGLKSKTVKDADGNEMKVDHALRTTASVLWDAVYIPGGKKSTDTLAEETDAIEFVNEAFRHCKAIAATGEGVNFVTNETYAGRAKGDKAIILNENITQEIAENFINAIAAHRNWEREAARKVPA
ncbi:MAG TPA: catalase [Pyrinomonadaceae bacterium]|nr:catalase [Pyrinomonadaceae bacterium]